MKIGLFLPSATNGAIASTTTPQFEPRFDKLLDIVTKAEQYGIEFGLCMAKLRGLGGASRFWDGSFEAFTLVSALIARTSRIKLFATAPILAMPPAIVARAAATIDSVSPGRFGVNIVTGWQRAEYESAGLWPGDDHYNSRYEFAAEYVTILRQLWATGQSDFEGRFFHLKDCRLDPTPQAAIDIVSAGQSDAGLSFAAGHADYSFVQSSGINDPAALGQLRQRIEKAEAAAGRKVGSYPTMLIVAAETDKVAMEKWEYYNSGIDEVALAWGKSQASLDVKSSGAAESTARIFHRKGDAAMGLGRLIGSYESVARMLDEVAEQPHVSGLMLAVGDWYNDIEIFGTRIQPLMKSRAGAC